MHNMLLWHTLTRNNNSCLHNNCKISMRQRNIACINTLYGHCYNIYVRYDFLLRFCCINKVFVLILIVVYDIGVIKHLLY